MIGQQAVRRACIPCPVSSACAIFQDAVLLVCEQPCLRTPREWDEDPGWPPGAGRVLAAPELGYCRAQHPPQRVSLPAMAAAPYQQGLHHLPAQVCCAVYRVVPCPYTSPNPSSPDSKISEKQRQSILVCRKHRQATPSLS